MDNKLIKKIIVNTLSISRIIGAALMPLFFCIFDIPVLIIIIASLFITDSLDGILARKWKVQTKGGALLDPLGDKLLAVSCIISFVSKHYILIPILCLELLTTLINVCRALHGEKTVTHIIGKVKMWIISITIVLCAINTLKPDFLSSLNVVITERIMLIMGLITILFQLITILYYLKDSIKQNKNRVNKIPKLKNFKMMLKILFDENLYDINNEKSLIDILKEEG